MNKIAYEWDDDKRGPIDIPGLYKLRQEHLREPWPPFHIEQDKAVLLLTDDQYWTLHHCPEISQYAWRDHGVREVLGFQIGVLP